MLKGQPTYDTLVRGVFLYGASSWTTRQDDFAAAETFDMACIRSILRVSRILHIPSIALRNRLSISLSIRENIIQSRIRYFGHVWRPEGLPQSRALIEFELENREPRSRPGRPPRSWLHCLTDDLNSRNFGVREAGRLATDRAAYKRRVVHGIKR